MIAVNRYLTVRLTVPELELMIAGAAVAKWLSLSSTPSRTWPGSRYLVPPPYMYHFEDSTGFSPFPAHPGILSSNFCTYIRAVRVRSFGGIRDRVKLKYSLPDPTAFHTRRSTATTGRDLPVDTRVRLRLRMLEVRRHGC